MARGPRRRLFAPTLVLLALVGTWTGHTLEYARVAGSAGIRDELFGSAHLYMLPLGALLVALAATGGLGWWRAWQALGRRLDAARAGLATVLRGHRAAAPPVTAGPSGAAGWGALALLLAGLQLCLYLAQENLEAVATGAPVPGLGAVLGVHAMAPLVHLAVASLLATLMASAGRLLRRRTERITRVVRLLRLLLAALAPTAPAPAPVASLAPLPLSTASAGSSGGDLRPPPSRLLIPAGALTRACHREIKRGSTCSRSHLRIGGSTWRPSSTRWRGSGRARRHRHRHPRSSAQHAAPRRAARRPQTRLREAPSQQPPRWSPRARRRRQDARSQQGVPPVCSHAADAAARTGLSERSVRQLVQIAEGIPQALRDLIRDTPVARRQRLLLGVARAHRDPEEQHRRVGAALTPPPGARAGARTAARRWRRFSPPRRRGAVGTMGLRSRSSHRRPP